MSNYCFLKKELSQIVNITLRKTVFLSPVLFRKMETIMFAIIRIHTRMLLYRSIWSKIWKQTKKTA